MLYYCCPRDVYGYFEWCMALKVSFPYTDDFQQLQIELCVLREEMKVMHDKVQRIVKTKKHGEEYVCWMVHANRDCCISSSHDIDVKMCYAIYIYIFLIYA